MFHRPTFSFLTWAFIDRSTRHSPPFWLPNLTSTYPTFRTSMISWYLRNTNSALIIDVLVSLFSYVKCQADLILRHIMLFGFADWLHHSAASMAPYGQLFCVPGLTPPECMIVVDTGFSFTHVVPMIDGRVIWSAVKRWANLCSEGYLIKGHLLYFKTRCWRQVTHQSTQRTHFLSSMEYDGRNLHNERCKGILLLCVVQL